MDTVTLQKELDLKLFTKSGANNNVTDCHICDLLSHVMAKGREDMVWITVLSHLNVIAVACLHDMACVIIPENIEVPQETLDKADENEIPVFSSPKTAYELSCKMCKLGIGI